MGKPRALTRALTPEGPQKVARGRRPRVLGAHRMHPEWVPEPITEQLSDTLSRWPNSQAIDIICP